MYQPSSPPPRLALIGVTGYGSVYWQFVRKAVREGRISLAAAVVINPDEAKTALREMQDFGTRVYPEYGDMMDKEAGRIDLCLIPTGIQWHARMTVAALRAGMNVLVEKPLAGSLAEVGRIRDAERSFGRWVAVGFQDMYRAETHWLKQALCSGVIGRVRRVRMVGLWPRPASYYARNPWAGKSVVDTIPVRDSPLNNAFAHFVNLSFFLAGAEPGKSARVEPTSLSLWRAHAIETFDTGFVAGRSPEGVHFEFFVSHCSADPLEPEITVLGESGTAEWRHEKVCCLYPNGAEPEERILGGPAASRQAMFSAVLRRLRDPSVFICGTELAEAHTAFIEAVHTRASIRPIEANRVEWKPASPDGLVVPSIRGLRECVGEGIRQGKLEDWFFPRLAELLAPSSRVSEAVSGTVLPGDARV
ncbi:MAG: gfo/Idh/MocA family oxidoreductase [Puniceicoccaceae bacterium]|nr:MAG: gfo/Idh/MocA family oxidoreductase [Puniceicoccaceae bacterium]